MAKIQSVEPNIADLANGWLKSYKRDYKLEQESLNTEIDQALNDYYSKNGGVGGNRPDAKLLLQDKNLVNYPILIEYKGYKDMTSGFLRELERQKIRLFSYTIHVFSEFPDHRYPIQSGQIFLSLGLFGPFHS